MLQRNLLETLVRLFSRTFLCQILRREASGTFPMNCPQNLSKSPSSHWSRNFKAKDFLQTLQGIRSGKTFRSFNKFNKTPVISTEIVLKIFPDAIPRFQPEIFPLNLSRISPVVFRADPPKFLQFVQRKYSKVHSRDLEKIAMAKNQQKIL